MKKVKLSEYSDVYIRDVETGEVKYFGKCKPFQFDVDGKLIVDIDKCSEGNDES